jgi:hypothetical protein
MMTKAVLFVLYMNCTRTNRTRAGGRAEYPLLHSCCTVTCNNGEVEILQKQANLGNQLQSCESLFLDLVVVYSTS